MKIMDVIVKWRDGTENCVSIKELKSVKKGAKIDTVGAKVKMHFKKRWYFGTVVMTEQDSETMPEKKMSFTKDIFSESDDETLINIAKRQSAQGEHKTADIFDDEDPSSTSPRNEDPFHDSDQEEPNDPDYVISPKGKKKGRSIKSLASCDIVHSKSMNNKQCERHNFDDFGQTVHNSNSKDGTKYTTNNIPEQCCEAIGCSGEVFSVCVRCYILLCWDHFDKDTTCINHRQETFNQDEEINMSIDSNETVCLESLIENSLNTKEQEDAFVIQSCEVLGCIDKVVSSCFKCQILLCMNHFIKDNSCENHSHIPPTISDIDNTSVYRESVSPSIIVPTESLYDDQALNSYSPNINSELPEHFEVEGSPREQPQRQKKRFNKQKFNKQMKESGKEYITSLSKKVMPARQLGGTCNVETCKKYNKECYLFDTSARENIFLEYWSQGNSQSQREYIARHVEKEPTKRKTAGPESKRKWTCCFKLPFNGIKRPVCKKMFLNTLNVGERTVRTTLTKITDSGIVEKDKRGGRQQVYLEQDQNSRFLIEEHIKRFPKVESHYCREKTTREYLHSDLNLEKMYQMFLDELKDNPVKPCYTSYRKVFKSMNLSFHRPKKDQCSLCVTYHEGSEQDKVRLRQAYTEHIQAKIAFRSKRAECKNKSKEDPTNIQCATFDLQQVITLPISNESAVFYKRRLSVYNLTFYDMTSGECFCYTWHEGDSKRGASEISTALYHFLRKSDEKGIKKVYLFSDGCSGQNKNSITASTLLHFINNSENIEEITLRFSIPGHGQNEGDSAHSAISYALKKSGDVFIPSQLVPIFKLARRQRPYEVIKFQYTDFKNFKKLSQDLKLLSSRKDDTDQKINWIEMTKFQVLKSDPTNLYFNMSHHEETLSRKLLIKRNVKAVLYKEVPALHQTPPKISTEKFNDLLSLTEGDTPVIKLGEYQEFYKSLPH